MTAAAVYLRVSSKDGRQDEVNQEPACLALCLARGWVPRVVTERESGAKRRPVWELLKEDCRKGMTRAVVFWALDRIGRNRVQVAHDVAELARWGVQVVSVQDPWLDQPAGPLRDLLLQIMAWVAEGERARLIDRTRAGLARARTLGKTLGRPVRLSGSDLDRFVALAKAGMRPGGIGKVMGLKRSTARDYYERWAKNGLRNAPGQPTRIRGL